MKHETCTTAPHPYKSAKRCSADQNQVGWRLHIVDLSQGPKYTGRVGAHQVVVNRSPALCGLRPRHGWGLDMFIDAMCTRCEAKAAKLKIEYEAP